MTISKPQFVFLVSVVMPLSVSFFNQTEKREKFITRFDVMTEVKTVQELKGFMREWIVEHTSVGIVAPNEVFVYHDDALLDDSTALDKDGHYKVVHSSLMVQLGRVLQRKPMIAGNEPASSSGGHVEVDASTQPPADASTQPPVENDEVDASTQLPAENDEGSESESSEEHDNEVSTEYIEALETENQALRLVVMSGLGFAIPETIEGVEANISAIQQVLNAHTEKLLTLKSRAVEQQTATAPWHNQGVLIRFVGEITREMDLAGTHDATVKRFKEMVLEYIGKNKTKLCYKKYVFTLGDVVMHNNREKVWHNYNLHGGILTVRPSGTGGAKKGTKQPSKTSNMTKKTMMVSSHKDELATLHAKNLQADVGALLQAESMKMQTLHAVMSDAGKGAKVALKQMIESVPSDALTDLTKMDASRPADKLDELNAKLLTHFIPKLFTLEEDVKTAKSTAMAIVRVILTDTLMNSNGSISWKDMERVIDTVKEVRASTSSSSTSPVVVPVPSIFGGGAVAKSPAVPVSNALFGGTGYTSNESTPVPPLPDADGDARMG